MQPLDRRAFIASLGGAAAVSLMSHEARADALEDAMLASMQSSTLLAQRPDPNKKYPTVAELAAQVPELPQRRAVGSLMVPGPGSAKLPLLQKMPARPTIPDFFELRFMQPRDHCLQSATLALKNGVDEEVILACLLHDTVLSLIRSDHGWWGAQMYEPYVSPKVTFAIRHHATLRFFPDHDAGYEYPELYRTMFGSDYVPPPHQQAEYQWVRKHRWYMAPRLVTVNDLYSFEPGVKVTVDEFEDVIGRHFKQPKEGLGLDGSPVAHIWRSAANPDSPL